MKKLLAVAIILLFIGMGVVPSVPSEQTSTGGVITVDDEGDGDYTSIKEALNNANPGDTIEVYSGTYYELNINIEKEEITFKGIPHELGDGNDTGKPFIEGNGEGHIFSIESDGVVISCFRIENKGGTYPNTGIGLIKGADNCIVSHNDISYTSMSGISGRSDNNQVLYNNISHSSTRHGIVFHETENNTIIGNNISDIAMDGILIWESNNNYVANNTVSKCDYHGIGILGSINTVEYNHIEDNNNGIGMLDNLNTVQQNNLINNGDNAYLGLDLHTFPFRNWWINNYWDRPRILPYPIFGSVLFFIPWVQFDWLPAREPYDIGGSIE